MADCPHTARPIALAAEKRGLVTVSPRRQTSRGAVSRRCVSSDGSGCRASFSARRPPRSLEHVRCHRTCSSFLWSLPAIDRSAIDPVPGGEATAKGRQGARLRQSVSAPRGNTPDPAQTNPSPARAETNPSPRHPANCTNEFLPAHARPMAHPRVTPYGLPDRTSARHPSTPEAKTRTGRQPAEPHPCHARHPDLPGPQPDPASPSAPTPLGLPARRGTCSTIRRFTPRSLPPCQWRASQSLSPARPCRGMPLTRRLVRYIEKSVISKF